MSIFDDYRDTNDTKDTCPKHIRGIVCDVKNCAHHDGENYCTAEKIAIGPSYATCSTDTVCASFKQKSIG